MTCDKCKKQPIPYEETNYGFKYGSATIERHISDEKKGWVIIGVTTPKITLQVYVTKTGKVRIYNYHGGEFAEQPIKEAKEG